MRKLISVLAGLALLGGLAACSSSAAPDQVGLWYKEGPIDGNKFDRCKEPGTAPEGSVNDTQFWVPTNVRTWNLAPTGGDSADALVVAAKPDQGQASGLEVLVWTQVNFKLNTYCGSDNKDPKSPVVQWWENLGRRYSADQEEGWRNMLYNTVVPALEKAKNTLRTYTADELVLGNVWADAERAFGTSFSTELERLSGGDYFCGPDFNRATPECSDVQVSIKDVDYRDPGIQNARNEKQKAVEHAAAQVAEANGRVQAAQAQASLYSNPQWMALEQARLQLEAVKACASNPNCRIVMGIDGEILLNQG